MEEEPGGADDCFSHNLSLVILDSNRDVRWHGFSYAPARGVRPHACILVGNLCDVCPGCGHTVLSVFALRTCSLVLQHRLLLMGRNSGRLRPLCHVSFLFDLRFVSGYRHSTAIIFFCFRGVSRRSSRSSVTRGLKSNMHLLRCRLVLPERVANVFAAEEEEEEGK